jgi:hypothetical protein
MTMSFIKSQTFVCHPGLVTKLRRDPICIVVNGRPNLDPGLRRDDSFSVSTQYATVVSVAAEVLFGQYASSGSRNP